MRVMITGAGGNLGGKLRALLEASQWCTGIAGIDVRPAPADTGLKTGWVVADLRDPADARWIAAAEAADAIVHFAAQSAMPDSGWAEAAQSFDMTANLLAVAARRPCRFVFASSNHAMGGYKDAPIPGGRISGDTPPLPGTRTFDGVAHKTSTAYGASKLLGERATIAAAQGSGGRLSAVALRIGWCQAGENRAATLAAHGAVQHGAAPQAEAEAARDLRWFRNMWLSNRDFAALLERALRAPANAWPAQAIVVAGVSNNRGTDWDLETGRKYLGYAPADDVWAELGQ